MIKTPSRILWHKSNICIILYKLSTQHKLWYFKATCTKYTGTTCKAQAYHTPPSFTSTIVISRDKNMEVTIHRIFKYNPLYYELKSLNLWKQQRNKYTTSSQCQVYLFKSGYYKQNASSPRTRPNLHIFILFARNTVTNLALSTTALLKQRQKAVQFLLRVASREQLACDAHSHAWWELSAFSSKTSHMEWSHNHSTDTQEVHQHKVLLL